jgi:hypothetical protein
VCRQSAFIEDVKVFMKKWIGPGLSFLVILALLALSGPLHHSKEALSSDGGGTESSLISAQDKQNDKKDDDSYFIQILKDFDGIIDGWLKSLNERIDSEDVTRLEVRFLEVLRNILEWVKEKLDAEIDSAREQQRRRERGSFRETRWRFFPLSAAG